MKDLVKIADEAGFTQTRLSRLVGCSQPHLSMVLRRIKDPSLRLARGIERETGGIIKVCDLGVVDDGACGPADAA